MNKKNPDQIFQEACEGLGISMTLPEVALLPERNQKAIIAFYKLSVIAQWMNQGWVPDWNDHLQWKYYPWFDMTSAGLGCSNAHYAASYASAGIGSRLCFRTSELAVSAGNDLLPLYEDVILIQK
jgi:hypothetical protein